MNEIVNKCRNAEMNLRQPGVFKPFTKNKEKIKKFKETCDSRCIYQNEIKAFENDMAL